MRGTHLTHTHTHTQYKRMGEIGLASPSHTNRAVFLTLSFLSAYVHMSACMGGEVNIRIGKVKWLCLLRNSPWESPTFRSRVFPRDSTPKVS